MPTRREREYYSMGYRDGLRAGTLEYGKGFEEIEVGPYGLREEIIRSPKKRRKLSAWNKYVKANSKKPRFRMRSGKLNLKKMGVAFRKTPAGKKKKGNRSY